MTEAGKKWAWNIDNKRGERFDDNYAHPLSEAVAEFWIRAFGEEVMRKVRAAGSYGYGDAYPIGEAFLDVMNNLLGEWDKT